MKAFTAATIAATAALAGLAIASPAAAQRLSMPNTAGFVLGYKADTARQSIREYVPRGQNVQNYRTMISSHRNPNPQGYSEPQYMGQWAKTYIARCPGARWQAVRLGAANGVRIDCVRHPATGRPDIVIARAIPMGRDMFLVSVTFRYIPMPRETMWAYGQLAQVAVTR